MRTTLASHWPRVTRIAVPLLAGALPALAFPAPALWWLAYVALVPWLLLLRNSASGGSAALTGWLGGTGLILAMHHWLLPSLHVFILVLAALFGLLWAPWGWLVRRLLHGSAGPARVAAAVVVVPSGWLMVELVRSWEYLGGPWGLLGASQWQVPPALRLASVGGVWLVSFVVVAVNTAVAVLVGVRQARVPAVAVLLATGVLVGSVWAWAPRAERTGESRVATVQAGEVATAGARFDRGEQLTRRLAGSDPDLIVWGESSVGFDLGARPDLMRRLAALSARTGAPVLVNVDAARDGAPGIYKSAVLVGPHGQLGERYDKRRLVPFGEYVPARSVLGWATSVGRAAGEDRKRGTESVRMNAGGLRFGPLICFETAFPDMSRQLASDGARVLVAQSSTSSFQRSWAPQQHASLAALRAAETGRPMVHATLTGVSAAYGPSGRAVGERLGTDGGGVTVTDVPLATGTTPYVRFGDWIVRTSGTVLVAYGALACARAVRERRSREGQDVSLPAPVRR